jgi:uncharacterized membrane protein
MTNTADIDKDARSYRLTNIDMLRGLVIIIMAIDHVRDYFMLGGVQDPMAEPDVSAGVYFTRWITHFCAPVFVFLAGTSIGLMAERKSQNEVASFVFKRGLWLVFVEIAIISTATSFAPLGEPNMGGLTMVVLQVIWVLGIGMLVLSVAQYMGARACFIIAVLILAGHNLLDSVWPLGSIMSGSDPFWTSLHSQGSMIFGPFYIITVYPLLPWIGVMLLGYGTAFIFQKTPESRDAFLLKTGLAFIGAFIVIRATGIYGDPNPWQVQNMGGLAIFFDFMNLSKYPPSLLFIFITLGPMAIVCAYADKLHGWLKDTLVMFGRVPFAFYVAHFYLIHLLSIFFGMSQGFEASQFLHFFFFYPQEYGTGLTGVYIVWFIVLLILYPFCKWMAEIKRRRKDWWLSYL